MLYIAFWHNDWDELITAVLLLSIVKLLPRMNNDRIVIITCCIINGNYSHFLNAIGYCRQLCLKRIMTGGSNTLENARSKVKAKIFPIRPDLICKMHT